MDPGGDRKALWTLHLRSDLMNVGFTEINVMVLTTDEQESGMSRSKGASEDLAETQVGVVKC